MGDSQRRTPRFPFSAPAEIISSTGHLSTRVTELSVYGCYLECAGPLARGARITIRITAGGQCFEANASVLYAQPTLGTGVVFCEVHPKNQAILRTWLKQSLDKQNVGPSIDDFTSHKQVCLDPDPDKKTPTDAIVIGEAVASLPTHRPILSIVRWGVLGKEVRYGMKRGFYIDNHGGGPALDVTVEPFFIIGTKTMTDTITQIAEGEQGFAPIWLDGVYSGSRWELDVALGIEAGARIKRKKMSRSQTLNVPVSVVYRDRNSLWYRSDCMMTFSSWGITFSRTAWSEWRRGHPNNTNEMTTDKLLKWLRTPDSPHPKNLEFTTSPEVRIC